LRLQIKVVEGDGFYSKKNFRRGGSYPPPEVRHGFEKPLNCCATHGAIDRVGYATLDSPA